MSAGGASNRDGLPAGTADVRMSTRWEAFILGLTLLSFANIAIIIVAKLDEIGQVALTIEITISAVLLGDFLIRLAVAKSRHAYLVRGHGWLDLVGCIPGLRLVRIFRVSQSLRRLGQFGGVRPVVKQVFANRAQGSLLLVLLVAIYVIEFGSMAMLASEAQSDDANIRTSSDALWYIMATISTVGYGDLYPTTGLGRLVGVVILIVGVGLFSTLTGFLANFFVNPTPRTTPQPSRPAESAIPAATPPAPASSAAEAAGSTIPQPVTTPTDHLN